MDIFFVYLISSDLGYNYIGQTNSIVYRLNRHNSNRSKATTNKGKWKIEVIVECKDRSEAVILESKLKKMKNFEKALQHAKKLVQSIPT